MDTSLVQNIGSKLATAGSKMLFKVKKFSPEILIGVGIVSIGAGTVLACKATLKADAVIDAHADKMFAIEEAKEKFPDSYSDTDELQDKVTTYVQTGVGFAKLYWPSTILMVGGVVCLLSAHGIMKQRNAAIAAAYAVIDKAFKGYRGRVVDELGKDKDHHFMYDTEYKTITEETTGEDGKKKKVKKEIQVTKANHGDPSMYARYYEKQEYRDDGTYTGSSQWCKTPTYNASTLVLKSKVLNDQFRAHGYMFLNDVYDQLGFSRTQAGQVVGWMWNGDGYEDTYTYRDGDNYISLGEYVDKLIDPNTPAAEAQYMHDHDESVLLDFNVDGVILDLLKD